MLSEPTNESSSLAAHALAERLASEMRHRWERGERPLTEELLSPHPALLRHPSAVGELIYEEVSLRRERGEPHGTSEVLRRFPHWAGPLRLLLDLRDALEPEREPDYPGTGEELGEFDLVTELGRGGRGRVYLARQHTLADRLMVVKLTPRTDAEHLSLARLQHTNIVPLYAVHDDPLRRVRALCMPFFGGATLAHVLAALAATAPSERTAGALWAAVLTGRGNDTLPGPGDRVPRAQGGADYTQTVVQIGACLADALHFAHQRNLVHMDVKPSNVLLTAEGQPMLLDFHLARPPVEAGGPPPMCLGGTPAYLSPEQVAALDAIRAGRPVAQPVDARTDIYSLGLVLYEALAGGRRDPERGPLLARNPQVSAGLADIIDRCLAERPDDRYPSAAALADDLRRHLANLPLRGTRNRSLAERWQKWRRRRPQAVRLFALLALVLVAVGLAALHVVHRHAQAEDAYREGSAELASGRFAEARGAFRRGLAVTEELPISESIVAKLNRGLQQSDRALLSKDLHTVAEGLRTLAISDNPARADLASAERLSRQLWERRGELIPLASPGEELPSALRERVRVDLLDLVLVWSDLRLRLAAPDDHQAEHRAVLDVLSEAEQLGPCAVLCLERARIAQLLGRPAEAAADLKRAAAIQPTAAWEHVAVGLHLVRSGAPAAAREEFERAVGRDPRSFWARLHLGRCYLALDLFDEARLCFAVCVGLDPDNPIAYLHRGLVSAKLGLRGPALADIERSLALDPTNPQALELRNAVREIP